ncbi:hypothetical protein HID58_084470 [Brassica napus]|uniref:Uncharacterized protein n=1 Tax=Brassica napus TaxID=3708 RepID=A0ABQ7XJU6_BRANA|nr:hypothetical protein HID58_084470 [Brassica napus]
MPSYNNYPPVFPRNVSPFPPFGTSNLPSYLYPQENVLNENAILNQGNDNIVEIDDDDDDDVDQPEKGHLRAGEVISTNVMSLDYKPFDQNYCLHIS